MKKVASLSLVFCLVVFSWFLFSSHTEGVFGVHFSGGAALSGLDRTGSPILGGNTCSQCHSGGTGTTNVTVVLTDGSNNIVTSYIPGNTYTIQYQISNGLFSSYGFQSVGLTSTNAQAGVLSAPSTSNSQISILSGRQYAEHTGISSTGIFQYTWVAPAAGTGNVTFYTMGNAINVNGSTSGDKPSSPNQTVFTEGSSSATLSLTAFIEGFYDSGTGNMKPVLLNSFVPGAISTECDTITVELHESTSTLTNPIVFQSYTGVLSTTGVLTSIFPASIIGNSYFIVLKHRSAIQTWSANPILMGASNTYDFSSVPTNVYGSNVKLLATGLYGLYSGDINYDQLVDGSDYPLWEVQANNFGFGYLKEDLNGDGVVDLSDYTFWENNSNNFIFVFAPF